MREWKYVQPRFYRARHDPAILGSSGTQKDNILATTQKGLRMQAHGAYTLWPEPFRIRLIPDVNHCGSFAYGHFIQKCGETLRRDC